MSGFLPTVHCSNYLTLATEAADGISLARMIRRIPALRRVCAAKQTARITRMTAKSSQLI